MDDLINEVSKWKGMTIVSAEVIDAEDTDYDHPILALSLKQPPSMFTEESIHRDVYLSADGEVLIDVVPYYQVSNRVDVDE